MRFDGPVAFHADVLHRTSSLLCRVDNGRSSLIFKLDLRWKFRWQVGVINMQMSSCLIGAGYSWNGNDSAAIVSVGHDTRYHHVRLSVGVKIGVTGLLASLRHPHDVHRRQESAGRGHVPIGRRPRRPPVSGQFETSSGYFMFNFLPRFFQDSSSHSIQIVQESQSIIHFKFKNCFEIHRWAVAWFGDHRQYDGRRGASFPGRRRHPASDAPTQRRWRHRYRRLSRSVAPHFVLYICNNNFLKKRNIQFNSWWYSIRIQMQFKSNPKSIQSKFNLDPIWKKKIKPIQAESNLYPI